MSVRSGFGYRFAGVSLATLATAALVGCGDAETVAQQASASPIAAPAVADDKPQAVPSNTPRDVIATPAYNSADAATVARADVGWQAPSSGTPNRYVLTATCKTGCITAVKTIDVNRPTSGVYQWQGLETGERYEITVKARYGAAGSYTYSDPTIAQAPVQLEKPLPLVGGERNYFKAGADYSEAMGGEIVLVMRNGRLIFRQVSVAGDPNPYEADPTDPNDVYPAIQLASGTKSFSCAFATAARMDGVFGNPGGGVDPLDQFARTWITEWRTGSQYEAEYKDQIKLRDLLSLRAGLVGAPGYGATPGIISTIDTYFMARQTDVSENPPNTNYFFYDPVSFQAFAYAFEQAAASVPSIADTDPVNYLISRVFQPIGMTVDESLWTRDEADHPQMAGGAVMVPEDWLKFAQLTIQNGAFGGRRILDGAMLGNCVTQANNAYSGYGLGWWLNRDSNNTYNASDDPGLPEDGKPAQGTENINPEAPESMYFAAGTGKERLYIFPEQNTVIIRMASLDGLGDAGDWSDAEFVNLMLPGIPGINPNN